MSYKVGVHTEDELKGLDDKERALLKEHILCSLQTSEEVQRIISKKLPDILAEHDDIRQALKKRSRPLLERLKEK